MEFISTVDGIHEFVPRFYGGDIPGRFSMMEDFGDSTALAMLSWFPIEILEEDRPWTGEWTVREALISTCLRRTYSTEGIARLRPLTGAGGMLSRTLQARWPESGDGRSRWPGDPENQRI